MKTFLVERTYHTLEPAKDNEDVQHIELILVEARSMPEALRVADEHRYMSEDQRGWVNYLKSKYGYSGRSR